MNDKLNQAIAEFLLFMAAIALAIALVRVTLKMMIQLTGGTW